MSDQLAEGEGDRTGYTRWSVDLLKVFTTTGIATASKTDFFSHLSVYQHQTESDKAPGCQLYHLSSGGFLAQAARAEAKNESIFGTSQWLYYPQFLSPAGSCIFKLQSHQNIEEDDQKDAHLEEADDDLEGGEDQNAKVGGLTSCSRLHCRAQFVKIRRGRPIVASIIASIELSSSKFYS